MGVLARVLSIVLSLTVWTQVASAKEMVSRLGIGVKNDTSINLPSMALSYHPTSEISITGGLGIDTKKDNSLFSFNGGVRRIVFKEDNMNFFLGGELGLINSESNADKQSGFFLSGLFGAEFFLAGLENLGFSFQGGVGVVSMRDVRFRTIGDSPLSAAVIFYF